MVVHYAFVGIVFVSGFPGKPVVLRVVNAFLGMVLFPILFLCLNNKVLKNCLPSGLLCHLDSTSMNPWTQLARNAALHPSEVGESKK